jgi:hypothetical protein
MSLLGSSRCVTTSATAIKITATAAVTSFHQRKLLSIGSLASRARTRSSSPARGLTSARARKAAFSQSILEF